MIPLILLVLVGAISASPVKRSTEWNDWQPIEDWRWKEPIRWSQEWNPGWHGDMTEWRSKDIGWKDPHVSIEKSISYSLPSVTTYPVKALPSIPLPSYPLNPIPLSLPHFQSFPISNTHLDTLPIANLPLNILPISNVPLNPLPLHNFGGFGHNHFGSTLWK